MVGRPGGVGLCEHWGSLCLVLVFWSLSVALTQTSLLPLAPFQKHETAFGGVNIGRRGRDFGAKWTVDSTQGFRILTADRVSGQRQRGG